MQGKIGTSSYINQALKENDLYAKKKFGQNFLNDQNILSSIVEHAHIDKDTLVIEVGPGLGSLTEHLVKASGFVLAYEIDKDLLPILDKNFKDCNNLKVINKDILEVDINKDIDEYKKNFKNVYLVANLPYYITTPIILGLLSKTDKIKRYVMMMQEEVAERICGKPKTKDYNALSIAIGYRAKAKLELKVPRTVFIPSPNVDSAVISLDLYDNPPYKAKNEELFFEFIRICFNQRRKTLYNNLGMVYKKDFVLKMLEDLNIKATARSEELDIVDFIKMSDYIEDNYDKN
ncbi:16S rRNA (adenine1518-N6/adenine1519-N6)-dimethyltransferase [Anaeroplasma bactoclasticum]|jgi:16S rRNA (adenine1518-N6/adenine1519-N6)-dimethyltransferase|uniref:Ribosomal RNA small subunit methyltransferase A n=1 Tax=Anaeroplasma bactoclasticum TaxID=2088 RepID=A0A397RT16_9MOLU|nr:16S rRNA (adenine(1518)-N(6)/adenine(1519)-N(6))-dimethyltransferase RsmA [Anaeroplasma bactoclasticum]RIA75559.1 16S rRNA (adenine1518-N6/adenine1519-N6)-dimethyltransferase [Anaeroplasma bactoclasticum]